MTNATPDPAPAPQRLSEALSLRSIGRRARENQLSGSVLMGVGLAVAVMAAVLLLWAGIVTGAPRVILLLFAALLMPTRMFVNRLSAVTTGDGIASSTNSGTRRWVSHWEAAGLMLAAGLCAFGSHQDLGPVFGLATAIILLLSGLRGNVGRTAHQHGRLYPTLILAFTCAVAMFEPLWGWHGQTLEAGLSVISVVLIVQALRPRRAAATTPDAG